MMRDDDWITRTCARWLRRKGWRLVPPGPPTPRCVGCEPEKCWLSASTEAVQFVVDAQIQERGGYPW